MGDCLLAMDVNYFFWGKKKMKRLWLVYLERVSVRRYKDPFINNRKKFGIANSRSEVNIFWRFLYFQFQEIWNIDEELGNSYQCKLSLLGGRKRRTVISVDRLRGFLLLGEGCLIL